MTNEEMLSKIQADRPDQVINKVISFKDTGRGYYDVEVDMEMRFFETTIKSHHAILPYPLKKYVALQHKYRNNYKL
jgi:hypothetical protein